LRTTRLVRPFAWRFPSTVVSILFYYCCYIFLWFIACRARYVWKKNNFIYLNISSVRPPPIVILSSYNIVNRWSLRVSRLCIVIVLLPPFPHTHTYATQGPRLGRRARLLVVVRKTYDVNMQVEEALFDGVNLKLAMDIKIKRTDGKR